MMRSEDVSRSHRSSSPSASTRASMTGTIVNTSQRCSATASSVATGSKRRRTITVSPTASAIIELSSPHE
jgi:hypothetical protein